MAAAHSHPPEPAALIDLAVERPGAALLAARELLDGRPNPTDASFAHQAIGIVRRDQGDPIAARRAFTAARRAARSAEDPARESHVLASHAVGEVLAGRTARGLALFDAAVSLTDQPRVRMLYGAVLSLLGSYSEAVAQLSATITACQNSGETLWEARARLARSNALLARGLTTAADEDAARAESLFTTAGQVREAVLAVHNRGLAAMHADRLPEALARLTEAQARADAISGDPDDHLDLAHERCAVLLRAGLAADAAAEVEAALARSTTATTRGELLLAGAAGALAIGDTALAGQRSRDAERHFRRQRRPLWAAHARLLEVLAAAEAGEGGPRMHRRAARVADDLVALDSVAASTAHLVAGQVGRGRAATAHLDYAATAATRTSLDRATRYLARALLAANDGRPANVQRACASGLAALDELRLSLGSPELQALATVHGRDLRALSLRTAARHGSPRTLLIAAERTRATAVASPPSLDDTARQELAALRSTVQRIEQVEAGQAPAGPGGIESLYRERARREHDVRWRQRSVRANFARRTDLLPERLFDALGPRVLIEVIDIDGTLHAVVARGRRLRHVEIGPLTTAATEAHYGRALLRRAAYGRPGERHEHGRRLDTALLGAVSALLTPDDEVVLVPPGRLHSVPWGMVSALADRAFTVAPSARLWLEAVERRPSSETVVLVQGPGLSAGDEELARLAKVHPHAITLCGPDASSGSVLDAVDGARLAHIAAHGDFRTENALFSALRLADGPLTGYDLQGLTRAPHHLVLAACDAGDVATVGDDAVLGLASIVIGRGGAGVAAPVVAVDDEATVEVTTLIHEALRDGVSLPAALLRARRATTGPAAHCASAFIPVGA